MHQRRTIFPSPACRPCTGGRLFRMWESVVPGALGTMTDVTFTITNQTHESRYHNQLGLLFVKADGSFDVGSVHPSDANYTPAALHDVTMKPVFDQNAGAGITRTYSLPAGKLVDFFFVQDDTIEDYRNNTVSTGPDSWAAHESPGDSHHPVSTSPLRPNVFFLNAAANFDGYAHFRTSTQTDGSQLYEVEDIAGGGHWTGSTGASATAASDGGTDDR